MALQQRNPLRSRGDDLAVVLGLVLATAAAIRLVPVIRQRRQALSGPSSPVGDGEGVEHRADEPVTPAEAPAPAGR